MIRVGLIGAGLIGGERLRAVRALAQKGYKVAIGGIYDADPDLCRKIAAEYETVAFGELEALLSAKLDWIVVAVAHDAAVPITLEALKRGLSVLLEKPMGRDLTEARSLLSAGGGRLRIGFNYRFFPGIRQALQDARAGAFGKLIGADFVLGHGCFPGQEKTWKLNLERAGGGCLIDPGIHLLDLCMLLTGGKIDGVNGSAWKGFWRTGIEEDVRLVLSSGDFAISLHVSIVQWRSSFEMQIHGEEGYAIVTGRGRSYGPQRYRTGVRWGWKSGASQLESERLILETEGQETFITETEALLFPSTENIWPAPCTAHEAYAGMELLDRIRELLSLQRDFSDTV